MNQQTITKWQHSPLKSQVAKEPAKEVIKLLQDANIPLDDFLGLPWPLQEEEND